MQTWLVALEQTWRVARQEFRLAWRSSAVAVLGVSLTVLTLGAAVVGQARYEAESAQRQRYQEIVGAQFADQPDRHPHRVSHYGYLLFRPRAPLGFFDSGLESFAGTSLFLEAHRQNTATFSSASQSGSGERFSELTLATVVQLILPLFVFAVAGTSLTREREGGTLALLLCQGASWSTVLWGKLIGSLAVVGLVAAPGVALSLLWLGFGSGWTVDSDVVVRLVVLSGLHLAFFVACAALAVAVSAWHSTSRGALAVLVGIWFALWVVVPRTVPALSAALYEVPSRVAFDAQVEARVAELGDSHNPNDPMFAKLRDETLRRYGVSRVEDLPFNYGGLVMKEGERLTSSAYQEHLSRVLGIYSRQSRLVAWAGVFSPYVAIRLGSMALAGSDASHQLEFERQAEAYRYQLIQALNDLHQQEVRAAADRYGAVVNGAPTRQRIDAAFFRSLPAFDFAPPDAGWALRAQATGLAAGAAGLGLIVAGLAWTAWRTPRLA